MRRGLLLASSLLLSVAALSAVPPRTPSTAAPAAAPVGRHRVVPAPPTLPRAETDYAAAQAYFLHARGVRSPEQLRASYAKGAAQIAADRAAPHPSLITTGSPWSSLGPGNVGGRTRAFLATSATTLYAGGVAGGVWKSTNGGASWAVLTDSQPNVAVSTLVAKPGTSGAEIFAGTGELFASLHFQVPGGGILHTIDSGANWTMLANGGVNNTFNIVTKLAFNAAGTHLYAATDSGLWRSDNNGGTWTQVRVGASPYGDGCVDVDVVSSTNGTDDVVVTACGDYAPDGIYRSTNGAAGTFSQVLSPTARALHVIGNIDVAVAPSNAQVLYASAAGAYVDEFGSPLAANGETVGIFESTNGGSTWSLKNTTTAWAHNCSPGGNDQGDYDNVIAVDPTNPARFWVGGIDLFVSANQGVTLRRVSSWFLGQTDAAHPARYVHADQHAITFAPDYGSTNHTVFLGNDGGLFRSTNADGAVTADVSCDFNVQDPPGPFTFSNLNNGYGVTQFYGGLPEPDGTGYFAGTQDNGTLYASTAQTPNNWISVEGGDGGYVGIDTGTTSTNYSYFLENPNLQLERLDGNGFSEATTGITDDFAFIAPFVVDTNTGGHGRLWAGGTALWKTSDYGDHWTNPAGGQIDGGGLASAIAIKPGDSNTVYVGFDSGNVWRSTNALDPTPVFTRVDAAVLPPSPGDQVGAIAVKADGTVYVTYQGVAAPGVWRSAAAGADPYTDIGTGDIPAVPVNTIAIDPINPLQIYAGTDVGVYESADSGSNWSLATHNLANTLVSTLAFQPGTQNLFAFTHGRGVWRASTSGSTDLTSPTVSVTQPAANARLTTGTISIAATATDNASVSRVDFFVDGNIIGSDSTGPSYTATDTGYPQGLHIARAVAYDPSGNVGQSSNVTYYFDSPATTISVPSSMSTSAGVVVAFNEPITGVSTATLYLRNGDAPNATVPGTLTSCTRNSAPTACSGTIDHARIQPSAVLVPGQHYQVAAKAPLRDAHGTPLLTSIVKNVVATRLVEETDRAVTYAWAQVHTSSTQAYGSYYRVERNPGATLHFTSTSRTITLYTIKGTTQGTFDVYANGVKYKSGVNNNATSTQYKVAVPINLTSIVPTTSSYDIKVVVTSVSPKTVIVDAVKIGSAVINSNPTATYTWRMSSGLAVADIGGGFVQLHFRGTGVTFVTRRGSSGGNVSVKVDSSAAVTVSDYAASSAGFSYHVGGLSDAVHLITVKILGTKPGASHGTFGYLDRFQLT